MSLSYFGGVNVYCDCRCDRGHARYSIDSAHFNDEKDIKLVLERAGWEVVAGEHYCPKCRDHN